MRISAIYDFLCPWCFVGKRHLDLAISAAGGPKPKITWHQFMLYPEMDRAGHDFQAFFVERYGEAARARMWARIRAVAEPIGIRFAFEVIDRGPASIDGHRVVRWAERQRPGSAAAMIESLASCFFEKSETIDPAFLVRLAAEHGFDAASAKVFLESNEDVSELHAETRAWIGRGVRTMPHFILTFADGSSETVTQTSIAVFREALLRDRALLQKG